MTSQNYEKKERKGLNHNSNPTAPNEKFNLSAMVEAGINEKLKTLKENQERMVRNEKAYYDAERDKQDIYAF